LKYRSITAEGVLASIEDFFLIRLIFPKEEVVMTGDAEWIEDTKF